MSRNCPLRSSEQAQPSFAAFLLLFREVICLRWPRIHPVAFFSNQISHVALDYPDDVPVFLTKIFILSAPSHLVQGLTQLLLMHLSRNQPVHAYMALDSLNLQILLLEMKSQIAAAEVWL
jgi:hypothetical protein